MATLHRLRPNTSLSIQSDDQLILSLEEIVPDGKKYGYEITWRRIN